MSVLVLSSSSQDVSVVIKSYAPGSSGKSPGSVLMLDIVLDFLLFRLSVPTNTSI